MKLSKTLIIFFILFFFKENSALSQVSSGKAIYGVTAIEKNQEGKDRKVNEIFSDINRLANSLRLELTFCDQISEFKPLETMNTDNNQVVLDMVKTLVSKGIYYTNNKKNEVIRTVDPMYGKNLFMAIIPEGEWKLHKETKNIRKYR